ncbi:type IV pilus assembly protein PilN [Deinobacterium chartae]|uniref:Type IV pilus assembly protein PilN n=1 Tax=Deinobacterium chartae TaxID=521158 RepID=A0A841I0C8_9DEIO|nr:hypothetical protein [Deinobacterium chartae]MBB6097708.1 type IV pilus assembly protein PilN [Deinobacterium chartae]
MIRINLLPKNLRKKVEPGWWRLIAVALPAVAVLIIVSIQLSASNEQSRLNNELENTRTELDRLRPALLERNRLNAKQAELQVIVSVDQALRAGNQPWSTDLARFTRRIPQSGSTPVIALNTLSMQAVNPGDTSSTPSVGYDGKTIRRTFTLQGRAASSAALVNFVSTFERSSDFGVQFQNAQREEDTGDYIFSVSIGMADPTAATPATPAAPTGTAPSAPAAPAAPEGGS